MKFVRLGKDLLLFLMRSGPSFFNEFIVNNSLIDIPLGGFNFTWTDKWGTKMSKLDRFLISESFYEVFPHTTGVVLEKVGCFKKSATYKLKKDLQKQISSIDAKVDQGCVSDEDLRTRSDFFTRLEVKRHLAIGGILKDGDWIEFPVLVKDLFLAHFRNCFNCSTGMSLSLEVGLINHFSSSQSDFLEHQVSRDEIKRAVWDCGGDSASGLDGFTFKFFTTFWDLIEDDVVRFVQEFFLSGSFPIGCNSSFISFIPKVSSTKLVTDFHLISLIGCQYKIIGKILANRLCSVIGSCISPEQSAFIKGRNVFEGPFILNEFVAWYPKRKKHLLVFKFDFEKAFDSLIWDFMDLVMEKIGFGLKWRSWILGCLCLQALTSKAGELGLFKGATFGRDNMSISHLMYADDVIFFGECNVLGVCVSDEEVSDMANVIGCGVTKLPFKYLVVPEAIRMRKKMTWVKWKKCLESRKLGGLGIGLCNWGAILTSVHNLKLKGPDFLSFCSRKIGNGASTRFWNDIWIGDQSLKNVVLTDQCDSWQWSLDVTHGFSVVCVRSLVDALTLDVDSNATRWIHFIPIKINVFLWRLSINKLPSRVNLDLKGTDVGSLLCPICHVDVESVNHIFFSCEKAKALWYLFAKWWELDIPFCDNISDWFTWLDSLKVSNKFHDISDYAYVNFELLVVTTFNDTDKLALELYKGNVNV
ncbi:RNA-directed DNA polymerase, eukaryota, reverse transcriptase zinc-binding domain protein [Tanacetum coccineum]